MVRQSNTPAISVRFVYLSRIPDEVPRWRGTCMKSLDLCIHVDCDDRLFSRSRPHSPFRVGASSPARTGTCRIRIRNGTLDRAVLVCSVQLAQTPYRDALLSTIPGHFNTSQCLSRTIPYHSEVIPLQGSNLFQMNSCAISLSTRLILPRTNSKLISTCYPPFLQHALFGGRMHSPLHNYGRS